MHHPESFGLPSVCGRLPTHLIFEIFTHTKHSRNLSLPPPPKTATPWRMEQPPKNPRGRPKGYKVSFWTRADDAKLRLLYPKAPWEEVHAALPGRSRDAITMRAIKQGIPRIRVRQKAPKPGTHAVIATLIQTRIDGGISLADVCKTSGLSRTVLFQSESGRYKPLFDNLIAWAGSLGYELTLKKIGAPDKIQVAPLIDRVYFDDITRTVTFDHSTSLYMTKIEYVFLKALIAASPGYRTKEQLHYTLYGGSIDGGPGMKIVDVWVCKVRKKLQGTKLTIATVSGDGYAITGDSKARPLNTAKGNQDLRLGEVREALGLAPTATFRTATFRKRA